MTGKPAFLGIVAASALLVLVACSGGSSGGSSVPQASPPPTPPAPVNQPSYQLGGVVDGLQGQLIIADGNNTRLTLSRNGVFSFPSTSFNTGDAYHISIEQQPEGMACSVSKGRGTVAEENVADIEIACYPAETGPNVCAYPLNEMENGYTIADVFPGLGSGLGLSGFSIFDFDNDGFSELLFGTGKGFGGNDSFVVVNYDEQSGTYRVLCQSLPYEEGIAKIRGFANRTYSASSLIALNNGHILVINHRSGTIQGEISTGMAGVNDLLVGDIDNDAADEIAVLFDNTIRIYDANSFVFEKQIPYGALSFSLGHFTSAQEHDLALNTGYLLNVGEQHTTIVWDYSALGFSDQFLSAGDIDADGLDEIVAADKWDNLRAFNADTRGILWEHEADHDIDALQVLDSDEDGVPEVLYGDGQWGGLYGLQGATGTVQWTVDNSHHGVTDLHIADLDQDDRLELIWGAGHSSTGPDFAFIHDLVLDQREWQSPDTGLPYYAVAYGNLDDDDLPDRVFASHDNERGGLVTAIRSSDGSVLWQVESDDFGAHSLTGLHALVVGDVDEDGEAEVVVGTDDLYNGYVAILDGSDGSLENAVELESGSPIYSLAIGNLDGQGNTDILAGGGKEHTGSEGIKVHIIDGKAAVVSHTFPSLGDSWEDLWSLELVDIDADNTLEVIAVWGATYILDADNNGLIRTLDTDFVSLATTDQRVYVGNESGVLSSMDRDGKITTVAKVCASAITALETVSPSRLALVCAGRPGIYDLDQRKIEWLSTDSLDPLLGSFDSLAHEVVQGRSTLQLGGSTAFYLVK